MSRVSAAVSQARRACADAFEPLWKPAPYIRGRHTPPEARAAHQAEAKRAAFAWLSRKVGADIADFKAITNLGLLQRCLVVIEQASIYDVERDPQFAVTGYGAAMLAHWKQSRAPQRQERRLI